MFSFLKKNKPEPEAQAAQVAAPADEAPKPSWRERLFKGLAKTRAQWGGKLKSIFSRGKVDDELLEELETEVKYEGYIRHQMTKVNDLARLDGYPVPPDLDFARVPSLSKEGRERMTAARPQTLGQASRLSGVRPADVAVLLHYLQNQRRTAAASDS